jgi:hypothetical protein
MSEPRQDNDYIFRGERNFKKVVSFLGTRDAITDFGLAINLGHMGTALSRHIAFTESVLSQAHSEQIAIAAGNNSIADGLISIALGLGGQAVAREGGTIAIAFYDQREGHWETPHGCDPQWFDGDHFLSGLKVAKVGENGIRANYIYKLRWPGEFVEIGPASDRKKQIAPEV